MRTESLQPLFSPQKSFEDGTGIVIPKQDAQEVLEYYRAKIKACNDIIYQKAKEREKLEAVARAIERQLGITRTRNEKEEIPMISFPVITVDYKWRKEVYEFLKQAPGASATATDIALYLIKRDNVHDQDSQKEIKYKMSVTLSTLFRDEKVWREKVDGEREFIYKLKTDVVLVDTDNE